MSLTPVQASEGQRPVLLRDVGIDQRLNEQVPLDLVFRDEAGHPVQLRDYFSDKPVIVVLAYYECPMLCTQVLDGLASSLRTLSFNIGEQFTVLTVSFNPRETPELAAMKKVAYIRRYARPGAAESWHFLTGEEAAIAALTRAVGFRYAYDPQTGQYAHASGIVVLTPQGKISRYFYGIEYAPRDLRLGLIEASAGKIGSFVDQVLLFCYHYDPASGRYNAIVMNMVRLGGLVTVLTLGTFLVVMWRRETRKHEALSRDSLINRLGQGVIARSGSDEAISDRQRVLRSARNDMANSVAPEHSSIYETNSMKK